MRRVRAGTGAAGMALVLAVATQGSAVGHDQGVTSGSDDEYVADVRPPETKILKGPKKRTHKRTAKFHFGTSEPAGGTFLCSLDGGGPKSCNSPERLEVGRGKHRFEVQAVDATGNVDPTPDVRKWRVSREGQQGEDKEKD